jgi:hypothetical protein
MIGRPTNWERIGRDIERLPRSYKKFYRVLRYKLRRYMIDKQALFEAVKEPLRLLVLAIIPFAIAYFSSLSYEWAGVIVLVLRFIDKYAYEKSKEGNSLVSKIKLPF